MDAKQFLKEKGISNNDFMDSGVADLIETLLTEYQALQLQQTGVSGSIYGYALEIIAKDYKGSWFKHYNHKLYETEDSAKNAIEQMKDFIFYSDFEWRIVPIYCH